MYRPRVLILSASDQEALDVAQEVQSKLDYTCEPTMWTQGIFRAGHSAYDSFTKAVEDHAYGVFVLTPDDKLESRGKEFEVPRMNVVFELGYFAAKHGIHRAFLLTPRGHRTDYLSDLAGIQPVDFDLERFRRGEQAAAMGPAIRAIEQAIRADQLQYPQQVLGYTNLLALKSQSLEAGAKYCLAAKLGSGHAIRLRLGGTPRAEGGDISIGWGMSMRPTTVAWDHSTGIVRGAQSFWASGAADAFTPFQVNETCGEISIEIYENADALDKQCSVPKNVLTFAVTKSIPV